MIRHLAKFILVSYSLCLKAIKPYGGLTKAAFNPVTQRLFMLIDKEQKCQLETGERTTVDISDYHGRILWLFGNNDFKVSRLCESLVRHNDIFLDIGANHGSIGFSVLSHLGPGGIVHFFEPQPNLKNKINDMIEQEGSGRAVLHGVALFESTGSFEMLLVADHSGMATIANNITRNVKKRIMIEAVEAYSYISGLVGERPFSLKIDIEGSEPQVLRGILKLKSIYAVQFEGVNNTSELQQIFSEFKFNVYGLRRTVFRPAVEYCSLPSDWERYHDFFASPERLDLPKRTMSYRELSRLMARARTSEANTP